MARGRRAPARSKSTATQAREAAREKTPVSPSPSASSHNSSSLSPIKSGRSRSGSAPVDAEEGEGDEGAEEDNDEEEEEEDGGEDGEEDVDDAAVEDGDVTVLEEDEEMQSVDEEGVDVDVAENEEGDEDDDNDEDESGDDEDEDDDDDDEDDDDEDDEGDEDEQEAEVEADEDDVTHATGADGESNSVDDATVPYPRNMTFRYPSSVPDFTKLLEREKAFKVARFLPCTAACTCLGLTPPSGDSIRIKVTNKHGGADDDDDDADDDGDGEADVSMEVDAEEWRTDEGWWKFCGSCGHGWEGGVDGGHVWAGDVGAKERNRRGKVVGRIEEILQDEGHLLTFPTPQPESISSLLKQLHHFVRPSGKTTVPSLPAALDLTSPRPSAADSPRDDASDDGRPRKRRRGSRSRSITVDEGGTAEPPDVDVDEQVPAHGKKKPGKTAGKGREPRTVVRGARGFVPMETDADGNQHVAGHLPDSAKGVNGAEDEDEDEEEDVPLARRPELDENERKRRTEIKEKEKEREEELVRRLTKGVNVEDGAEGTGRTVQDGIDVEIWEGVELPKLPLRPAAIEQKNQEIILPVVSSRNPTPVATILLIGLKNLFQRQLPKMPREYITRLVLDKNHISVAIVKRGWKVVGGICYRPFESRGFAEIVFCAVDSSEQIKGYGFHLMSSLKDHVRAAHPTINHFLTYADNYAVGYFKKQGFTKEISFPRERWVGYIKDYEGGTIMQCTMLPKVRYLEVHQMLADQKAAILAKIRTISRSHIVHPGLQVFKERKPGQEVKLAKEDVPGLAESGWNPDLDDIIRQPKRNPHHVLLQLVLNDMQNEPSAWPFTKPVDSNVVADYYDVIANPMDLSTMEYKLENNHYESVEDFLGDAKLIFDNCRQYNGEKSTYTKQANALEKALDKILKKRQSVL